MQLWAGERYVLFRMFTTNASVTFALLMATLEEKNRPWCELLRQNKIRCEIANIPCFRNDNMPIEDFRNIKIRFLIISPLPN